MELFLTILMLQNGFQNDTMEFRKKKKRVIFMREKKKHQLPTTLALLKRYLQLITGISMQHGFQLLPVGSRVAHGLAPTKKHTEN